MILKGQLHTHTTMSDGRLTPQETADLYEKLGFDFLAFTDHDHLLKPSYRQIIKEVKTGLVIFLGIELTIQTRWGYVHVSRIEGGGSESLFIFNHPADYGLSIKQTLESIEDVQRQYPIEAVEVTHLGFYTPAYDNDSLPYPKIASDDSHTAQGCGRAWIEMDADKNKDNILKQIKAGNFTCCYARGRTTGLVLA